MKKLQNHFTTPEQSKRLMGLGVPADSADCYYYLYDVEGEHIQVFDEKSKQAQIFGNNQIYLPCWSVGRLIEIYVIARGLDTAYLPIERGEDMVKYLIRLYEEKAKDLDFSKLEE